MSSYFEALRLLVIYDAIDSTELCLPTEIIIENEKKTRSLQTGARTKKSFEDEDDLINQIEDAEFAKKKRIKEDDTLESPIKVSKKRSLSIDSEIDLPPVTNQAMQHDYLNKYNTSETKITNPLAPISSSQLPFISATESALTNVKSVIKNQANNKFSSTYQSDEFATASSKAVAFAIASRKPLINQLLRAEPTTPINKTQSFAYPDHSKETSNLDNCKSLDHRMTSKTKSVSCETCGKVFIGSKSEIYKRQHTRRVHLQKTVPEVKIKSESPANTNDMEQLPSMSEEKKYRMAQSIFTPL